MEYLKYRIATETRVFRESKKLQYLFFYKGHTYASTKDGLLEFNKKEKICYVANMQDFIDMVAWHINAIN